MKGLIKLGSVDIANSPHFLISYSDEYGCDNWKEIAVFAIGASIDDIRLQLLNNGIHDEILSLMYNELNFYLFEIGHTNPLSYLVYHVTTLSNVYSRIHFEYIPFITCHNLLYFIKTHSKQICIYDNGITGDLKYVYLQLLTKILQDKALGKKENPLTTTEYNKYLEYLHKILFTKVSNRNGFEIKEPMTYLEFARWVAGLSIDDLCIILNYFKHFDLVKNKDIVMLMKFYYQNHHLHDE